MNSILAIRRYSVFYPTLLLKIGFNTEIVSRIRLILMTWTVLVLLQISSHLLLNIGAVEIELFCHRIILSYLIIVS